jgi:B-cell receptor-associated protein 31
MVSRSLQTTLTGTRITHSFVAILFLDALQRMFRVAQESQAAKQEKGVQDIRVETNQ